METTFISIHDLSDEARILYASDSIVDILGYAPEEVVHRPCWDFFHPDEIPLAQSKYGKGVALDKAAYLSYCRMRDKDGRWLGCEVIFTVVYDVLVSCTSIYRRGLKSHNRAMEAPSIRRLFSGSPQDPRYHMLSHISSKFERPTKPVIHEPRAALFLNRYTRTLTIMYATNGLAELLGLSGEEMIGKSFYYCIQEGCLQDAVRCLENAKLNDSIAYLRFWYRDPRQDERTTPTPRWRRGTSRADEDGEGQGAMLQRHDTDESNASTGSRALSSDAGLEPIDTPMTNSHLEAPHAESRASSGDSNPYSHEAVFGERERHGSSMSSTSNAPTEDERSSNSPSASIELEAVISCTSDGLVVCLRQASQQKVDQQPPHNNASYENGLFASPWSKEPILPVPRPGTRYEQSDAFTPRQTLDSTIPQPLKPAAAQHTSSAQQDYMNSIRDIAIFAWAVVGINGSLADYGHGQPRGESQPAKGLPIWDQDARPKSSEVPRNGNTDGFRLVQQPFNRFGESRDPMFDASNQTNFLKIEHRNGARTSGFGFGDPGLSSS